jgi:hypothetical protein
VVIDRAARRGSAPVSRKVNSSKAADEPGLIERITL